MKGSDPEAFNTPKTGLANAATLVYSADEVETSSMAKMRRLFLQITSSNSLFSSRSYLSAPVSLGSSPLLPLKEFQCLSD